MFRVKDSIHVNAPRDRVFLLSTSIPLVQQILGMKPVSGKTSGLVVQDDQLLWRGWKFGLPALHETFITRYDRPHLLPGHHGPRHASRSFQHDHSVRRGRRTTPSSIDTVRFSLPLGPHRPSRIGKHMLVVPHVLGPPASAASPCSSASAERPRLGALPRPRTPALPIRVAEALDGIPGASRHPKPHRGEPAMKAVVLHEYGGPEKLKLRGLPRTPSPAKGEVLLRVAAASINPVDCKMRSGEAKEPAFPYDFPGHPGPRPLRRRPLPSAPKRHRLRARRPGSSPSPGTPTPNSAPPRRGDLAKVPEGLELTSPPPPCPSSPSPASSSSASAPASPQGQTVLIAGARGRRRPQQPSAPPRTCRRARHRRRPQEAARRRSEPSAPTTAVALDDPEALAKASASSTPSQTPSAAPPLELLLAKVKQGGVFASVLGPPCKRRHAPHRHQSSPSTAEAGSQTRMLKLAVRTSSPTAAFSIPIDRMLPLAEMPAHGQAAAERGGLGKVLLHRLIRRLRLGWPRVYTTSRRVGPLALGRRPAGPRAPAPGAAAGAPASSSAETKTAVPSPSPAAPRAPPHAVPVAHAPP